MNDFKMLLDRVKVISKTIPLGLKETGDEIGISLSQWNRLLKGASIPYAKTIRKIKAFIEKYKDIQ